MFRAMLAEQDMIRTAPVCCADTRGQMLEAVEVDGMKVGWLGVALLLLVPQSVMLGQRKGQAEQKKEQTQIRLPDEQEINLELSEMLGAWQIGDVQLLHKYYADDVAVVSGVYEPPLFGWANYLAAYQRQRARVESVRLDRMNTYITVKGNIAWAIYQWDFSAVVDGKPTSARGHTTLILEKRKDRWLIVHNHTSVVPEAQTPETAPPPGQQKPGA